jgi:hypothetical protein
MMRLPSNKTDWYPLLLNALPKYPMMQWILCHCRNQHIPEISWKCWAKCKVCWLAKLHQSASCYCDTNETPFLHTAVETAYLAPTYPVTHWPVKLFMLWYCEDGLDHLSITNIYFNPGVTGSSCTPYRSLVYALKFHTPAELYLIDNNLGRGIA